MSCPAIDPRLRLAIDASVGWYEDLCALHGVGSIIANGLWSSIEAPPPLHSDAVAMEPMVTLDEVQMRLEGRTHAGFKDSFGTVPADAAGMEVLFSATWIHREPLDLPPTGKWSALRDAEELATWTANHDTANVLLPGLLARGHFRILACRVEGSIVAGAVARLASGGVDVSNVHAIPGYAVDWEELAADIADIFPGRPMVGYERGDALMAAVDGGFQTIGDLRVWVR